MPDRPDSGHAGDRTRRPYEPPTVVEVYVDPAKDMLAVDLRIVQSERRTVSPVRVGLHFGSGSRSA